MTKLTQEELDTIKALNEKSRAVTVELGEIELMKIQLIKRRKYAEQYLEDLRSEQESNGKILTEKYGDGTIDLESGEFKPVE
jgi:hypothetical protein